MAVLKVHQSNVECQNDMNVKLFDVELSNVLCKSDNNFITCAKAENIGLDSLYCGKWRKISKSRFDLDRTVPNVELVRAIFIYRYYNMVKFQVN